MSRPRPSGCGPAGGWRAPRWYHARTDGLVSLAVVASAVAVALGLPVADAIIGLVITLVILHITWQSWRTVRHG